MNCIPAVVRDVNTVTGVTEREFALPINYFVSADGPLRNARITANGTLLEAFMDLNKVVEYNFEGKAFWSSPAATLRACLRSPE